MNISNIENEIIVHIKNSINVALIHNGANLKYWYYILNTDSERTHLINLGTLQAKKFISNLELENDTNPNPIFSNLEVETQAVSDLVDRKILYVLNTYFKYVSYIFYIYFIVILYIFTKNIKI